MVTRSGTVKLMDFGIAKAATDRSLTVTGNLIGSLYYMSPEQVKAISIDSRSDLYSVGIVLYQMATGKKPFDGDSEYRIMRAQVEDPPTPPTAIEPAVPDELSNVILRALAKDPAERFQTGEEFREALGRVAVLLKEDAAGATRMLGRDRAAPAFRSREAPTAPVGEPDPIEPVPRRAAPASSARHPEPAPAASDVQATPVRPLPPIAPREPLPAASQTADDGELADERPARSRTPLWIAAGIAAAILTVAATQMFDWMAGTSDRAASGETARLETPAKPQTPTDRGQPSASDVESQSTAPPSSVATPSTTPAPPVSPRETASVQRQTAAPSRRGGEAPDKTAGNAAAKSQTTPGAPAARATPPAVDTAPLANNLPPVRTDSVAAPASGSPPRPVAAGASGTPTAANPGSQTPIAASGSQAPATKITSSQPTTPAGSAQPQTNSPSGAGQAAGASPTSASPAPPIPEPPADRVYLPNEVDSLPGVLDRIQPRYSGAAAQAKAEGVVRLEAEIWPDGRAHGIRVVQSAGHPDLDRNAVAALARWTFIPGRKNRLAVKVRARIDFPFSLQSTTQRPALTKDK
jgi:TonB family protein